jgi:hypothetical protein
VVRSLGFVFTGGTHYSLADRELLEPFVNRADAAAAHNFECLVLRHGPMVFDVFYKDMENPQTRLKIDWAP